MSCLTAVDPVRPAPVRRAAAARTRSPDLQSLHFLSAIGLIVRGGGFVLLFEMTSTQGFIKLERALNFINELAIRDELTGGHNRRHLIDLIESERSRSARAARPFCLCLLDIDFFKRINDTYGHSAGDAVLRAFAAAVQAQIRDSDCFGRYGGEEFLLMLPETTIDAAAILVERMRAAVEALRFADIDAALSMTVSIGVAEFRPGESSPRASPAPTRRCTWPSRAAATGWCSTARWNAKPAPRRKPTCAIRHRAWPACAAVRRRRATARSS